MKNIIRRFSVSLTCLMCLLHGNVSQAFEPFVIEDIRVEGLRRISAGTVFTYLPVSVGDSFDDSASDSAIRALYDTGFFHDIELLSDGTTLVVKVVERSAIAKIDIFGNELLEKEPLLEGLKDVGLAEGRVYDRSVLSMIEQELRRQYFSNGNYDVRIETTVTPIERNRVSIRIDVAEGDVARIKIVNVVGNKALDEDDLLDEMELGTKSSLAFWSSRDKYAKQKLSTDLERLRSYYLDRGFLDFEIRSTNVSLTPDKSKVYITINISEGEPYKVSAVHLSGSDVVSADELMSLVPVESGDLYVRKEVNEGIDKIVERLGAEGYAFAKVNAIPRKDEANKTVDLTYFVDAGRRVYVRRINFSGNEKTRDQVLRRELRLFEGGWYSAEKLKQSKLRLQRLGFFAEVEVETPPVAGALDQVDVNFRVVERPSGTLEAGIGYAEGQGFLFNASINQENVLGTGNKFGIAFNNSKTDTVYSLNFLNPYYTIDGISRGFDFVFRQTDTLDTNISDYAFDSIAGSVKFGFPISEEERINVGVGLERLTLKYRSDSPQRVLDFVALNGESYDFFKGTLGWTRDSRNNRYFATDGSVYNLSFETTLPGSDLEYYKLTYKQTWFHGLNDYFTLVLEGNIGFGDGYGNTGELPFFQNFYAGGVSTVRGFRSSTLGPRNPIDDTPIGGNLRLVSRNEIVFPVPFLESDSVRLAAFVDAGNAYDTHLQSVDLAQLRASTGLSLKWLSPLGAVVVSVATPLIKKEGDDTEGFQFTLGQIF